VSVQVLRRPAPWDAIVVGSGATGGWAAHQLARRGLSVLVLEAGADGPDLPADPPPLRARVTRKLDVVTGRRGIQAQCPSYWELDPDLFVRDTDHPFSTPEDAPFHWFRSRGVNGKMLTWGGIGVRTSDHDLLAPAQDGFGPRWPLSYADLAPHYDEIDAALPVYGEPDRLSALPDGRYVGSTRLTDAEQRFREVLRTRMPDRKVVASRGVLVRPSTRRNGEAGPPSLVRRAIRLGATLRSDAVVSHLTVGPDQRATGVAFVDRLTGRTHEIPARTVVLCASTLESTRILLNTGSAGHVAGFADSSGALGRYLMDHLGIIVSGYLPGDRDAPWTDGSGGPKNIIVPRFHNLDNRDGGAFLRGYGVFGGIGRHTTSAGLADRCSAGEVPFTLVAYGEMLPYAHNRVTLRHDRPDRWGIPTLHIECRPGDNERAMTEHMRRSLTELVEAADGRVDGDPYSFTPGGFVHEVGTARMGDSPDTSVVNPFGQCWDSPNVFVMDGAVWPGSPWQNPTFTMMAIAGRACDRLAQDLADGRL
jgi:choline dehydrogenase-like flavoprotein